MRKYSAIILLIILCLTLAGCQKTPEPVIPCAGADYFTIQNTFDETPYIVDDPEVVKTIIDMYNTFTLVPHSQTMDFLDMYTLTFYKDSQQVLRFTVDDSGYLAYGEINKEHFKIKNGFDYDPIQNAYFAVYDPSVTWNDNDLD